MSKVTFSLSEVVKLLRLNQARYRETDELEQQKHRDRMVCAFKSLIRYTDATQDLETIRLLMETIDQNKFFDFPVVFPDSLWKHLDNKIVDKRAIEQKGATAIARSEQKKSRREARATNLTAFSNFPDAVTA